MCSAPRRVHAERSVRPGGMRARSPIVAGLSAVHQNAGMTGELRLADDSSGHGPSPEFRASDRERDQVVEILQVAAGDGRLTAAELDERLDAALSARTTVRPGSTDRRPAVGRNAVSLIIKRSQQSRCFHRNGP
ncbi:DUF1707 domain-containing protein [Streptomyces sp900116325]|uniref:DUF1707 SHOCT-like domain-containing protein n=1 Tax=Streptomyces sp. 900116325 TaxID=3154295 RepID=UPI0033AE43AA